MKPAILRTTFFSSIALIFIALAGASGQSKVHNAKTVPPYNAAERLPGNTVAFFVIGDWSGNREVQRSIAEAMYERHNTGPAVAVLTTGDNFHPEGVSSRSDPLWEMRFEDIYPPDKFPIPFYSTLGEIDYKKDPEAQTEYHGTTLPGGSTHWHMPGRYWTHVFASAGQGPEVRITGIDTKMIVSGGKEEREAQLAWLDSVLRTSDEDWNIVLGHHPVYSNGRHGNTLSLILQAKPLFEKHGVDAYFAGHDHNLEMLAPQNGVRYIVSGAGGETSSVWWRENTVFASVESGFVWVQFNMEEMLVQFINREGVVLYSHRAGKR